MTFVLEDGEQIDGTIEWYDRNAIKVRRGRVRTLIYKAGIKYLYKTEENSRGAGVNGQLSAGGREWQHPNPDLPAMGKQ